MLVVSPAKLAETLVELPALIPVKSTLQVAMPKALVVPEQVLLLVRVKVTVSPDTAAFPFELSCKVALTVPAVLPYVPLPLIETSWVLWLVELKATDTAPSFESILNVHAALPDVHPEVMV